MRTPEEVAADKALQQQLSIERGELSGQIHAIQNQLGQKRLYAADGRMLGPIEFNKRRQELMAQHKLVTDKLQGVKAQLQLVGDRLASERLLSLNLVREVHRVLTHCETAARDPKRTEAAKHVYREIEGLLNQALDRAPKGKS